MKRRHHVHSFLFITALIILFITPFIVYKTNLLKKFHPDMGCATKPLIAELCCNERLAELIHALIQYPEDQLLATLGDIIHSDAGQSLNRDSISEVIITLIENKNDNQVLCSSLITYLSTIIGMKKCLQIAVDRRSAPLLDALLKLSKNNNNTLYYECQVYIDHMLNHIVHSNKIEQLEFLVGQGIRISKKQATMLLDIVVYEGKDPLFIPFLTKRGADVNKIGQDGKTLLSYAVSHNKVDVARLLLEAGATIDNNDRFQEIDIIARARHQRNPRMAELLDEYYTE